MAAGTVRAMGRKKGGATGRSRLGEKSGGAKENGSGAATAARLARALGLEWARESVVGLACMRAPM